MTLEVIGLLAVASAASGSLIAQVSGPLSCNWPEKAEELEMRILALRHVSPPRGIRSGLACFLLATLLAGGTLTAYAAEPSAPEMLSKEVVGVTGSGDQLELEIKEVSGPRTLKVGEEYREGWKLQALTAVTATLSKDNAIRTIGLNPTGAVAPIAITDLPETQVTTLSGFSDAALIQHAKDQGDWDGLARAGLTLDQTQRLVLYRERIKNAQAAGVSGAANPSDLLGGKDALEDFQNIEGVMARYSAAERAKKPSSM